MKKSLQVLMVLAALGIALSSATVGLAQARVPMVGAYSEVATDDPEVKKAAEFAVAKQKQNGPLSLVSIESAARQVVAGTNYSLCLKVKAANEDGAGEEAQDVKAVVFRNLKNKYSLTSWEESDCGADDSGQNYYPQPAASVAGVYENFTVGKGSGDLEGMRVIILQAGGGYHAIVQAAAGGAEDPQPEFVPVNVKGMSFDFTAGSMKYTGTAIATGLRLKDADGTTHTLKRKPCATFFR
jgi:hypothetical protein